MSPLKRRLRQRKNKMSNQVPVLLVIFNRPEKTRRVMDALRQVQPTQLFVAADGPRSERPDDIEKCRLAREAATDIDWPCEVQTRFLEENVGCGMGVSSGITWFFEQVEHGIILEDDCLPHPHFFPFCAELFNRYAQDQRIMGINGLAPYPTRTYPYDYHFSRRFRCWGWATWRRAWQHFSYACDAITEEDFLEMARAYYPHAFNREPWLRNFRRVKSGELKTWAFRYEIAQFAQSGLFIAPEKNLITNIGFDEEGTHTRCENPIFSQLETQPLGFPLRHPPFVFADGRQERHLEKLIYCNLTLKSRCMWRIRHSLGMLKDFCEEIP